MINLYIKTYLRLILRGFTQSVTFHLRSQHLSCSPSSEPCGSSSMRAALCITFIICCVVLVTSFPKPDDSESENRRRGRPSRPRPRPRPTGRPTGMTTRRLPPRSSTIPMLTSPGHYLSSQALGVDLMMN